MFKSLILFLLLSVLLACLEPSLPKQHAYPQIDLPKHTYEFWHSDGVPYSFEKPVYTIMKADTSEPFWYNLVYLPFDATLFLSYRTYKNPQELDTLIHDSRNLVYKHTVKASDIIDNEIPDSNGRSGMYFLIDGETATPYNFYLTDNKSKFFRGALYFNNYTTIDSVGPIVDFIKTDINQMIRSFKFE